MMKNKEIAKVMAEDKFNSLNVGEKTLIFSYIQSLNKEKEGYKVDYIELKDFHSVEFEELLAAAKKFNIDKLIYKSSNTTSMDFIHDFLGKECTIEDIEIDKFNLFGADECEKQKALLIKIN